MMDSYWTMTAKQRRFVDEFLVDLDARAAAIRAGYHAPTAAVCANKLLSHPEVRAEIARRRQPIEADAIMTARECILALCEIARSEDASNRDKIQALKLIGTYHGSFVKKIETAGPGEFSDLTDDEINSELRELAAERQRCRATDRHETEVLQCQN